MYGIILSWIGFLGKKCSTKEIFYAYNTHIKKYIQNKSVEDELGEEIAYKNISCYSLY